MVLLTQDEFDQHEEKLKAELEEKWKKNKKKLVKEDDTFQQSIETLKGEEKLRRATIKLKPQTTLIGLKKLSKKDARNTNEKN